MDSDERAAHICRAREGDERSFAVLWKAYHEFVVNYLVKRWRINREDALDLCSDTFVDLWRKFHKFRGCD